MDEAGLRDISGRTIARLTANIAELDKVLAEYDASRVNRPRPLSASFGCLSTGPPHGLMAHDGAEGAVDDGKSSLAGHRSANKSCTTTGRGLTAGIGVRDACGLFQVGPPPPAVPSACCEN